MLWRWEKRKGKWTKPPLRPDGRYASSTDPSTWSSYEAVIAAYQAALGTPQAFDGIGIVLPPGIVALDVDNCMRDGDDAHRRPVVRQPRQHLQQLRRDHALRHRLSHHRQINRSQIAQGENTDAEREGLGRDLPADAMRYITITGSTLPT